MAGKRWNVNPRFVICEDQAAVAAITSGFYPVGTIMYRQDMEIFSKWNGSAWIPLSLDLTNSFLGKKQGRYVGTHATAAEGLLNPLTLVGTSVGSDIDYTNNTGGYHTFRTATTTDANAGHKTTQYIGSRELNTILAIKILPLSLTNNRIFAGLKANSNDLIAAAEDPLANLNGIGLLKRAADTQWQIVACGWTANSQIINTSVNISTTVPTTVIFQALEASTKWRYSLDLGVTWGDVTGSNSPQSDTRQCYVTEVQSVNGSAQDLRIYDVSVASDK
jgi:hypothetical protein